MSLKGMSRNEKILFALVVVVGVVSLWRGIWGLFDVYLLPDDYATSSWISTIVGVAILVGTHHFVKEIL